LEDLARRLGVTPTGEGGTQPGEQTRPGTRLQVRLFHAPGVDLWKLAENLTRFYASQQLDSETSRNSVGAYVIRCHSAKIRARMTGAGAQLTVTLSTHGDDLSVVISGQRWGDKAASMGTGLVAAMATSGAALPLVVPSIIGGVRQAKLPKQTFDYIEKVLPICIE
jgi:hypothetical protein